MGDRHWRSLLFVGLAIALPLVVSAVPARPMAAALAIGNAAAINGTSYIEGDDYATTVLGDPWDMDSIQDLQFWAYANQVSVNGGILQATTPENRAAEFFPLFMNFEDEIPWYPRGADPIYRIDSSRYTRLAYRVSTPLTWGPVGLYWWNHVPTAAQGRPFGTPSGGSLPFDTCLGSSQSPWPAGFRTTSFDLTSLTLSADTQMQPWGAAPVTQFRFGPLSPFPQQATPPLPALNIEGASFQLDWIRLVDPASAPTIPLTISGTPAFNRVGLFVRPAGSPDWSYSRAPLVSVPAGSPLINLPTALLPPGQWDLTLISYNAVGTGPAPCTISDQPSAPVTITIHPGPRTRIVSPSMTSAPDFATEVLGRPWNLASSSQIIPYPDPYGVCQVRDVTTEAFTGGIYSLTAIITAPPANPCGTAKKLPPDPYAESDSHIFLTMTTSGGVKVDLDPATWRYLVVRLKQNVPSSKDLNWVGENGGGGRLVWFTGPPQAPVTSQTRFGLYVPGWYVYAVDLGSILAESGPSWLSSGFIANVRYDISETRTEALNTSAADYEIDFIRITRMPSFPKNAFATDGGIPVSFIGHNVGPGTVIEGFYTTTRTNPTQNVAAVTLQGIPACAPPFCQVLPNVVKGATSQPLDFPPHGNATVRWNAASVTPGEYFFCLRTTNSVTSPGTPASRSHTSCTDVPIRITAP